MESGVLRIEPVIFEINMKNTYFKQNIFYISGKYAWIVLKFVSITNEFVLANKN